MASVTTAVRADRSNTGSGATSINQDWCFVKGLGLKGMRVYRF